jgi:thiamine pyrophosphate-dependent acetolactate synthase large subunit-like protein
MHKESHQYIDLIGIMRPIVKWNARVSSPEIIPEVVRKAFAVAESEKPGATHLELPEDVMQRPLDASPLPRHAPVQPEPGGRDLQRAAEMIDAARNPLALAGNGAIRGHAAPALRSFVHNTGIPVAETFMAKGLVDYEDPKALGRRRLPDELSGARNRRPPRHRGRERDLGERAVRASRRSRRRSSSRSGPRSPTACPWRAHRLGAETVAT